MKCKDNGHGAGTNYFCADCDAFIAEQERKRDWKRTYNAVVTGLHAYSHPRDTAFTTENAHKEASRAADMAHGPLNPEPAS